jgi:hypothetical protein
MQRLTTPPATSLPLKLTPTLRATTLFWSLTPLVYGTGEGLGVGSGVPPINNFSQHFFTGRSDNFDPKHNSGDPNDAHFDSEGMRLSNDGLRVYVSDEYGPYIYEFDRLTGLASGRSSCLRPSTYPSCPRLALPKSAATKRRPRLFLPIPPAELPIKVWKAWPLHQTAARWWASCKIL